MKKTGISVQTKEPGTEACPRPLREDAILSGKKFIRYPGTYIEPGKSKIFIWRDLVSGILIQSPRLCMKDPFTRIFHLSGVAILRALFVFRATICLFCALTFLTSPATAQTPENPDKYVQAFLVPEKTTIAPGETIRVALIQTIHPGWHVYWKNPGDSGEPTRITWTLPDGFAVSDLRWPVPERVPFGPLLNFGYHRQAVYLQTLTALSGNPDPDKPLTLKAHATWLVCEDICIPEQQTFEIRLNDPQAPGLAPGTPLIFTHAERAMPIATDWPAEFRIEDGNFTLDLPRPENTIIPEDAYDTFALFPEEWGLIDNTADARVTTDKKKNRLKITIPAGERDISALPQDSETVNFVLAYTTDSGRREGLALHAKPVVSINETPASRPSGQITLLTALGLALLGGMILNLMPCVFPVLSIKVLALTKMSEKSKAHAAFDGLAYTAGILVMFAALGIAITAIQATGNAAGWGFQLQSPVLIALLAQIFFLIGMNLIGTFEIGGKLAGAGQKLLRGKSEIATAFLTGLLAAIVATPCTAPFMGAALGYALTQPPAVAFAVFCALGLGLAAPYLLFALTPPLRGILPRPGNWMVTFRQLLAFPMFAATIWLLWVLTRQAGDGALLAALSTLVTLAFAIWLITGPRAAPRLRALVAALVIALSILAVLPLQTQIQTQPQASGADNENANDFGKNYSQSELTRLLHETSDPVFVEMTAAWCITCKVNERIALNTPETRALFKTEKVHYLIGDWTNRNPEITAYLDAFGRRGVPIYVYYGPPEGAEADRPAPRVLPQILTPGMIKNTLGQDN